MAMHSSACAYIRAACAVSLFVTAAVVGGIGQRNGDWAERGVRFEGRQFG